MNTILITGSNRGLGLEWVRQYTEQGWRVYATCRDPEQASDLQVIANNHTNVIVHQLDVTSAEQLSALQQELTGISVDIIINNAGVYYEQWGRDPLGYINYEDWQHTFAVNTLGAMRVSEALIDNVSRSNKKLIVAITSHMGSISDLSSSNDYAYRSSKAALNTAMKGLSYEVANRQIGILILHPGWVRTRMGGDNAPLTTEQSVSAMRELVENFNLSHSGHFYRYDGSSIPW